VLALQSARPQVLASRSQHSTRTCASFFAAPEAPQRKRLKIVQGHAKGANLPQQQGRVQVPLVSHRCQPTRRTSIEEGQTHVASGPASSIELLGQP